MLVDRIVQFFYMLIISSLYLEAMNKEKCFGLFFFKGCFTLILYLWWIWSRHTYIFFYLTTMIQRISLNNSFPLIFIFFLFLEAFQCITKCNDYHQYLWILHVQCRVTDSTADLLENERFPGIWDLQC